MSGGHSDNGPGTDAYSSGNFNSTDIQNFASTDAGKGFDPGRLNQLSSAVVINNGHAGAGGWFNGNGQVGNPDNNISDVVMAFNAWKASQGTDQAAHDSYVNLATNQPGRDQTVLGTQLTPGAVLGGR